MHLSHGKEQSDLKDDENENQTEGSNSGEWLAKRPKKSNDSQKSLLSKLHGDTFSNDETVPQRLTIAEKVKRKILLYEAEHTVDLYSDPLQWWNERKHTWPLITKLIQKKFQCSPWAYHRRDFVALWESTYGNIIRKMELSFN